MSDFALQFIPEAPPEPNQDGTYGQPPEGFFVDPRTGAMTSRELLRGNVDTSRTGAAHSGALQGMSLGWADELLGLFGRAEGGKDMQRLRTEQARAIQEANRGDFPGTSLASEIAGTMAIPAGSLSQGGTIAAQAARGAATGAVGGALYGAGATEGGAEDRIKAARTQGAVGALVGGAAGAAIPAATRQAQKMAARRTANKLVKTAPTEAAKKATAQGLYNSLDERGVVLAPESFGKFVGRLTAQMDDEGIDTLLTPTAARGLERIKAELEIGPVSIKKLDTLRKVVNSAPQSASKADLRLVEKITNEIDDYVYKLVDADILSNVEGAASGIGQDLKKARTLWKELKNSERMSEAIEAAQDAASGFENGLRVEFRKILRNKAAMSKLSDAEKDAVREVVRGTFTGNLLKKMSRLGFGRGQQSSVLSGTVASGAAGSVGALTGGPVGAGIAAAAPPILGAIGSRGAEASTLAAANRARAIAISGGLNPEPARTLGVNALRMVPKASLPVQNALTGILQPR